MLKFESCRLCNLKSHYVGGAKNGDSSMREVISSNLFRDFWCEMKKHIDYSIFFSGIVFKCHFIVIFSIH